MYKFGKYDAVYEALGVLLKKTWDTFQELRNSYRAGSNLSLELQEFMMQTNTLIILVLERMIPLGEDVYVLKCRYNLS